MGNEKRGEDNFTFTSQSKLLSLMGTFYLQLQKIANVLILLR